MRITAKNYIEILVEQGYNGISLRSAYILAMALEPEGISSSRLAKQWDITPTKACGFLKNLSRVGLIVHIGNEKVYSVRMMNGIQSEVSNTVRTWGVHPAMKKLFLEASIDEVIEYDHS